MNTRRLELPNGNIEYRNEFGELHSPDSDTHAKSKEGKTAKLWYKNGRLHREGDKPSYENDNLGISIWYKQGKRHRDNDKPAYVDKEDGTKGWYQRGKRHREGNRPALIDPTSSEESNIERYYHHGKQFYPPKHEQENGPHDYD